MKLKIPQVAHRRTLSGLLASVLAATVAAVMVALMPTQAVAIATPVPLGTAADFSVLAGSGVTNTGPTVIGQDLGTHPTASITGFPPGIVLGDVHAADQVAGQAKSDLVIAYNQAAGQATDFELPAAIGGIPGQTLIPGVYTAGSGVLLTGDLILDARGNPNAVWVFQIPEALTTASGSRVFLTNGASPCNVFWQVGSSATLGTGSTFVGTIMALMSISANTGANIQGRALAREGAVTLDSNNIFLSGCATSTTGGTTTGTTGGPTTGGTTGGPTTGGPTTGGPTTGGPTTGGPTTGGTTGGPIVTTGGTTGDTGNTSGVTSGNTSGNTAGNTSGVTSGNTSGNTAGNTSGVTSGNTSGNTAGNTTGGNGGKPGKPDHGGKPGKPDHGGKPGKPDYGGKPGKPDHGKQSDEHYGYDKKPKGYGDGHSKSHEG
ncbi:ice-binding family protein [Streptomyces sp. DG1A-41]|uniref:ice-binding family protein n=1 Tax=Streptomyces sp. DG1A-41 TaxID=3125779 RepID=UPI0030CDA94C